MTIKNVKFNYEIEKAIIFLVKKLDNTTNKKPVVLHSIKVGMQLMNYNYSQDIILAGFLHDLIEDSNTSYNEIEKNFNKNIADLVEANTFDINNPDRLSRSIDMFHKCKKLGKEALIIKAADTYDNMDYFNLVKDIETKQYLIEKWNYFIKFAEKLICKEVIYKNLLDKCHKCTL